MFTFEFNQFDEQQIDKLGSFIEFGNDNLEGTPEKLLHSLPLRGQDSGKDLFVGMFVNDDSFKDLILAGEVVIDSA